MKSLEELNAIKQEYKSAVLIRTSDYGTRYGQQRYCCRCTGYSQNDC